MLAEATKKMGRESPLLMKFCLKFPQKRTEFEVLEQPIEFFNGIDPSLPIATGCFRAINPLELLGNPRCELGYGGTGIAAPP